MLEKRRIFHKFEFFYNSIAVWDFFVRQEFLITLQEPVPQPSKHEEKEWWHADCTRTGAEDLLKRVSADGVFLVRPSEKEVNSYAISFR